MHKQHRDTLEALFSHPIQRGISLGEVEELCRALGAEVSHLDQNRLQLRWPEGERTWLHAGSGKGKQRLNPEALLRLRRVLEQQGIRPGQAQPLAQGPRGDQSHRLVLRMNHQRCDVFHLVGEAVEHAVLRPHGLWGSGERLSHRHDRDIAGQRAPLDNDYLKRIEQAMAQADVVLLVGHGTGQSNMAELLIKHLSHHQPALLERIRTATVDDSSLSDEALLALARQQFGNLPHRHTLRIPGQPHQEAPTQPKAGPRRPSDSVETPAH